MRKGSGLCPKGSYHYHHELSPMPVYDLDKIKFSVDGPTFERAVDLYQQGKVTEVEEALGDYAAVVKGTKPYRVSVSARSLRRATCTCYLGQHGTLCKHVVALALHAVLDGRPLREEDFRQDNTVRCSGRKGELRKEELTAVKKTVTGAMRCLKPYTGPSRTWFAYQASLSEGRNRLTAIVCELPVSRQTADLLVKLLLRLDRKLSNGIDDSDGTVSGFMRETVGLLQKFAAMDPDCRKAFKQLANKDTAFGWEAPLVEGGQ